MVSPLFCPSCTNTPTQPHLHSLLTFQPLYRGEALAAAHGSPYTPQYPRNVSQRAVLARPSRGSVAIGAASRATYTIVKDIFPIP